ncbi:MAG: YezD family protein [Asticcacaulis sp.]
MSDAHPFVAQTRLSEAEQHILNAISEIRFGTVEVVIHDSRIVQIEKSEKFRFDTKKTSEAIGSAVA